MNKSQYKAQASQQRKQENAGDVVTRTLERNLRRDFRCLVQTPLRKLAKQIHREVDAVLQPERVAVDNLMAY